MNYGYAVTSWTKNKDWVNYLSGREIKSTSCWILYIPIFMLVGLE